MVKEINAKRVVLTQKYDHILKFKILKKSYRTKKICQG